jgi:transcriptional regulator with XRE-family HTH domain
MTPLPAETFRTRIRKARIARGWGQREVARMMGVAPSIVCQWETGVIVPRPVMVNRLCGLFNLADHDAWNLAIHRTLPRTLTIEQAQQVCDLLGISTPTPAVRKQPRPRLTCRQCGHGWMQRRAEPPTRCPHCSRDWTRTTAEITETLARTSRDRTSRWWQSLEPGKRAEFVRQRRQRQLETMGRRRAAA